MEPEFIFRDTAFKHGLTQVVMCNDAKRTEDIVIKYLNVSFKALPKSYLTKYYNADKIWV
jgi:hypothetical protein